MPFEVLVIDEGEESGIRRMKKQRNQYLDIIKACGCVMVVYVHSGNLFKYAETSNLVPVLSMLAQCGVPIFFAVSGYLSAYLKDKPYLKIIKKKLKSLIIPFVIWNLLYLIAEMIGHCIMPSAFEDITGWTMKEYMFNLFGIPFIQPPIYIPLWFVRELFILFLLYPIIVLFVRRLPVSVLGFLLVAIIIGYMPALYDNGYYLKSSVPFFTLGLFCSLRKNNEEKEKLAKFCAKREVVVGTAEPILIWFPLSRQGK